MYIFKGELLEEILANLYKIIILLNEANIFVILLNCWKSNKNIFTKQTYKYIGFIG